MADRRIKTSEDLKRLVLRNEDIDESEEQVDVNRPVPIKEKNMEAIITSEEDVNTDIPSFLSPTKKEETTRNIKHDSYSESALREMFSEVDVDYTRDPKRLNNTKVANFLGDLDALLSYTANIESMYARTLPTFAYGIIEDVLLKNTAYEIIVFNGIKFLSNKTAFTDIESFNSLVENIEEELAINGFYRASLVRKCLIEYNGEYVSVPTLLVNTYEYNSLQKAFTGMAKVSIESTGSSAVLIVEAIKKD